MSTEDIIKRFVLEQNPSHNGHQEIGLDESLISNGLLDSMALLKLVLLMEEQFGVSVGDGELVPSNFETISQIKRFVETKRSAR